MNSTETECPICSGPCDLIEEDDPHHEGEKRRIFLTRFANADADAIALGRLQNAADTLGWTIDVIQLSAESRQYIVYNDRRMKIGNGATRLNALKSANGMAGIRRPRG